MSHAVHLLHDDDLRGLATDDERHPGALVGAAGALPLRALAVRARITGLLAETTVRQAFENTTGAPVEATYIFPLPPRAAVTRFRFEVNGRVIEGDLKERGEARRTYDRAIKAGHSAAIAEEERPDVFTMRVGNLVSGATAHVELTLSCPLEETDGEATFRFPLVVAPRYIPGRALGGGDVGDGVAADTDLVPDASRISPPVLLPGYPSPVRLGITVELDPGRAELLDLRSSLHAVTAEQPGRVVRVDVVPGERLDRDFILRFSLAKSDVVSTLTLVKDGARRDEGCFALTLVPPAHDGSERVVGRDVVFVVDRSGSMGGWKMIAARRAVARMIDSLGSRDRFQVIAFDNRIELPAGFSSGLIDANDRNRYRVIEWLSKVQASGGTEMERPLLDACHLVAGGTLDRHRAVVLITDGQVGNEARLVQVVGGELKGSRFFGLGIDEAVNSGLLSRLASASGGASELVESEDRLDQSLDRLHRALLPPVIAELSLEGRDLTLDIDSVTPARLPGLFPGAPLTIFGRYRGSDTGRVVVRGRRPSGQGFELVVDGTTSESTAVPTLFAKARLRDLEDLYELKGDPALARSITELSLHHRVLCRFTAFVAVDRTQVVNEGGRNVRVTQAVESSRGWDMLGTGDDRAKSAATSKRARTLAPAAPAPAIGDVEMAYDGGSAEAFDALDDDLDDEDLAGAELEEVTLGREVAPLDAPASRFGGGPLGAPPAPSAGLPPPPPAKPRAPTPSVADLGRAALGDEPMTGMKKSAEAVAPMSKSIAPGASIAASLRAPPTTLVDVARTLRAAIADARKAGVVGASLLRIVVDALAAHVVALTRAGAPSSERVALEALARYTASVESTRRDDAGAVDEALRFVDACVAAFEDGTALPTPPPGAVDRRSGSFWS